MSMNECFVRGCCNRIRQEISFFRFPQNEEMLKKWKANLRIAENEYIPRNMRICKIHFEPKYIGKGRLYLKAIPTLNLGLDDRSPTAKPSPTFKRCAIKHCRKPSCEVRMFLVPDDPKIRRKWLSACDIPYNDKEDIRLCEEHFESEDLLPHTLKADAFPTLNLVEEQESISVECAKTCNRSCDELQNPLAILTEPDIKLEEITQDELFEEEFMDCSLDVLEKRLQTTALQPQNRFLQKKLFEKKEECSTSEETSNSDCCLLLKKRLNMYKMIFVKKEKFHRTQNAKLKEKINNMQKDMVQLQEELQHYKQKEFKKY